MQLLSGLPTLKADRRQWVNDIRQSAEYPTNNMLARLRGHRRGAP